jgi:ABC-type phosphate transport system substrate-binding protein
VKVVHLDPQMIELLDRYGTSLGFLNQSALQAAKTPLVRLALDGVRADAESLASGRYPIFLEFGLVYRGETLTEAGKAFIRFIGSPEGRQVRDRLGVVAVPEKR